MADAYDSTSGEGEGAEGVRCAIFFGGCLWAGKYAELFCKRSHNLKVDIYFRKNKQFLSRDGSDCDRRNNHDKAPGRAFWADGGARGSQRGRGRRDSRANPSDPGTVAEREPFGILRIHGRL